MFLQICMLCIRGDALTASEGMQRVRPLGRIGCIPSDAEDVKN